MNAPQKSYVFPRNQTVPPMGPVAARFVFDFTATQEFSEDLTLDVQQKKIDQIQGIYIDANDTNQPVTVTFSGSGQRIIAKGGTQGYYPVLATNPPGFKIDCAAGVVTIYLYNMPVPGQTWPSV
jgi:hypothetical protein